MRFFDFPLRMIPLWLEGLHSGGIVMTPNYRDAEPNDALEPIRVPVTEGAISPLRGGTFCASHSNGSA